MRRLLALAALVACDGPLTSDETDASLAPLVCSPPATLAPAAAGGVSPPVGAFPVAWECVSGCDGTVPLVIARANGLAITMSTRENGTRDGILTWSIDGAPLYPIPMTDRDGCWYQGASVGGCHSDFFVCDRIGRATIAHIAIRDAGTGVEQVWKMN